LKALKTGSPRHFNEIFKDIYSLTSLRAANFSEKAQTLDGNQTLGPPSLIDFCSIDLNKFFIGSEHPAIFLRRSGEFCFSCRLAEPSHSGSTSSVRHTLVLVFHARMFIILC
jgi:hypothetical protein